MSNEAMREALRRIKYEACSLADAQVIALEALAQAEHELEKAEQQEPVAWRAWSEAHGYTVWETLEEAKHYSDEDPEPLDLRHSRKKAEAQALPYVQHKHEWFSTGAMKPGEMRCIHCGMWFIALCGDEAQALRQSAEKMVEATNYRAAVFAASNDVNKQQFADTKFWEAHDNLDAALRQQAVGINGLTEAETAASASVMGLVRQQKENN